MNITGINESFSKDYAKYLLSEAAVREDKSLRPLQEHSKAEIVQLISNAKDYMNESSANGSLTTDIAPFFAYITPLIRRIHPTLIANELLGVQPLKAPLGYLYAIVNEYLGDGNHQVANGARAAGAIYEFSSDDSDKIQAAITDGSLKIGETKIDDSVVLYFEEGKILVSVSADAQGVNNTKNVGDTVTLGNATDVVIKSVYTNESSFGHILKNFSGPYTTSEGEQLSDSMREIGFALVKKNVEVTTSKLKTKYTQELYQDLKAMHGLEADSILLDLLAYEIQAEIDRRVVDFVKDNSTWLPDTVGFGAQTNMQVPDGRWEIERYRAQAIRISAESIRVGLDNKRGQGNVLLVSPMVYTMLREIGNFNVAPVKSDLTLPVSGGLAGTFDNRYKVVVDQYAKDEFCTVLYKGNTEQDAMGFYMPYQAVQFTKVTDPNSAQPAVIAQTRYALTTVPGVADGGKSNDRAKQYARSFGINFANTVLNH